MIPGTMPRSLSSLSTGFLCGISLFALALLLPAHSLVHAQGSTLPELGEAATRYLDPDDEQMIGRRFLRELMAMDSYISSMNCATT